MEFKKIEYRVSEFMGPPQTLLVTADGRARYESYSDVGNFDRPEIGVYETTLSAAETAELNRLVNEPPLQNLPDHWGRIAAGDRYKRISLTTASNSLEKIVGTHESVDSRLKTVLDGLDGIVAGVMRHPRQTIRIEMSDASVDSSGKINAEFTLSNTGIEAANCVNPVTVAGGPDIAIRGWPDRAPSTFQAGDAFNASVGQVQDLGSGGASVTPVLQIVPGTPRRFRFSAVLPLHSSGAYIMQLHYQNTNQEVGGKTVLLGEIYSKSFQIDVQINDEPRH